MSGRRPRKSRQVLGEIYKGKQPKIDYRGSVSIGARSFHMCDDVFSGHLY